MTTSKHIDARDRFRPFLRSLPASAPSAPHRGHAVSARRGLAWRRMASLSMLLLVALVVAACGGDREDESSAAGAAIASVALPADLGPAPEQRSEASESRGDLASAISKVPELMDKLEVIPDSVEEYLDAYNAEYQLSPRQGTTPLEIAETYMRRYQPGPLPRVFQHSVMTDRHGTVLAELVNEGRRTWVPIEQISSHVIDAIIATEDASFYENQGIDARRVIAALMQNASSGGVVSGASTITMQLARNMFFTVERRYDQSMERKVFEMLLSQDLTMLYTKDEILEMYLNLIYFGHRAYGIEAASQVYFGKSAAELTLAEATLLAGIPQQPAALDPMQNLEAAKERQRVVLDLMARRNIITQSVADAVFKLPITVLEDQPILPAQAPHFVNWAQVRIANELGIDSVGRAGLRITTTLDLPMQELAQEIVRTQVDRLRGAHNLNSAALIAMRPPDGQILAMVGSADYDNVYIDGNVNATISPRQPGSSIKPILYAAAFNDNIATPSTVLWDLPVAFQINELTTYRPINYDEKFHGPVTARAALANSFNIPAVKLLDWVGPDRMAEVGYAMGLKGFSTQKGAYGLPLTLGANEVTLLDLTTAYHTLQNGGVYSPYQLILTATDALGRAVDLEPELQGTRVLGSAAAYQVTSVLSDRDARAPMFGINSILNLSRPAAAKTGTTNSYRDNLTMGYTRYMVAGVWAGNPSGQPMNNVTGITGAAPIWHDFMEAVIGNPEMLASLGAPEDPAAWEFEEPETVVRRQVVCPDKLVCPENGEFYSRDWLQRRGLDEAQSDAVIKDKVLLVTYYRGGQSYIGVCSDPRGEERTYMTLPEGAGRLAPPEAGVQTLDRFVDIRPGLPAPSVQSFQAQQLSPNVNERVTVERLDAITWSRRNGTYLNFGSCNEVDSVVRSIVGEDVRNVFLVSSNGTVIEELTPTPTPQPTATFEIAATPTLAPPTATPTATPTNTPLPTATSTPLPTATSTPLPTATSTPLPTATSTPLPTATSTPLPTATSTPLPTATSTPLPTATSTPLPTATSTSLPTATSTSLPTATSTSLPTATSTSLPTATPTNTPTVTPIAIGTPVEAGPGRAVPARTPAGVDLVVPGATLQPPATSTPRVSSAGVGSAPPTSLPTASTPSPTATAEPPVDRNVQPSFAVASVTDDAFCSNDTIAGQVLDATGSAVPGVRIIGVDQWGNFLDAETGSGAEAGRFSIAIGSDAREYYMTVVDATGAPLSFTVTVQHRLEGEPQNRCHTIVWKAR